MEKQNKSVVYVPPFLMPGVPGVTFGGFAASRYPCADSNKLFYWGKSLPEAMVLAADRGKGWHLITAFEWAAGAYLWKQATTLDDCVFNLYSFIWQWNMGLFMHHDGHVDILADLDVTYTGSPYGRGTVRGSAGAAPELVLDGEGINWLKRWKTADYAETRVYIAEADGGSGAFYNVASNTPTTIILAAGSSPGNGTATFVIVRHVPTDITAGMESGNFINSLRDSDFDLAPLAIPASSSSRENTSLGGDSFWFCKAKTPRAAVRGGHFSTGAAAGVFALDLLSAPSYSGYSVGFRACKALESDTLEACI